MSEANILNPSADSLLNPRYGYVGTKPELLDMTEADSGKVIARNARVRGRIFDLTWERVPLATMHSILQWEEQYQLGFFTFVEWERTRYYSGHFAAPLSYVPEGNEAWTIRGQFKELPGKPMNTYPSNWSRDAIFLEERDDNGDDLIKQTGTWTYGSGDANSHGGARHTYPNADTTGKAEWVYAGYGCRIWGKKANDLGIFNARVTRVRDGTVMAGPTAVDQYNSSTLASAALFTSASQALDRYRVAIEATNTKNASSSAKTITADAIEVMR